MYTGMSVKKSVLVGLPEFEAENNSFLCVPDIIKSMCFNFEPAPKTVV